MRKMWMGAMFVKGDDPSFNDGHPDELVNCKEYMYINIYHCI